MEMTAKSHIPVESYGFIEIEYSFIDGDKQNFQDEIINDYHKIKERFKDSTYEYSHVSGVNWRKKLGKWEYLKDGEWIEKENKSD